VCVCVCVCVLASLRRLFHLHVALVVCSIGVGGGLVKLVTCSDVPGRWVDVWRSGIHVFFLYRCSCGVTPDPVKHCQDCQILTAQSLRDPWLCSVVLSLACVFL